MIRAINRDKKILAKKSLYADRMDISVAQDLLDTFEFHKNECVGMAANMIGVLKRIIVFKDENDGLCKVMFNPVIISSNGEYKAEEGCLSLPGTRKTIRYFDIVVEYQDMDFILHRKNFYGLTAQIIQHEIDMTNGILI